MNTLESRLIKANETIIQNGYNFGKNLGECLRIIKGYNYDKETLEIVVKTFEMIAKGAENNEKFV